ncbi:MAG: hypothetical protein JJ693_08030 [Acidithiobacillus sp.]|nr:hypothetical protein [Acidithiobacillus sp.]
MAEEPEGLPPVHPHAQILEGKTKRGKPCRLIDNTASVDRVHLQQLLEDLIDQDHFQPLGLSTAGGNAIQIGAPQSAHVQLGEDLYRLIIIGYEARLEVF